MYIITLFRIYCFKVAHYTKTHTFYEMSQDGNLNGLICEIVCINHFVCISI